MKKIISICIIGMFVLLLVFFLLLEKNMNQPMQITKQQLFTVKSGTSVSTFSKILVNNQWLKNPFWLGAYARLYPEKTVIKAGTYQIEPQMSLRNLLALVTSGKEHQFSLTIVEGSTVNQLITQLNNQPQIKHTLTTLSHDSISQHLGIEQQNAEGWFFPETYAFTQGTTELDILARAHKTMKTTLNALWQDRASDLPYQSPYEALIMASIIEKETSYLPEQPLIASVFINRLAKKMRLQTDPTIIYGLGERYHGDITRAHIQEQTAYNTYRIDGLPPTPIALPGLSAIKAALNPKTSDYYYFVSGGNGKHVFSKTLKEHNAAVRAFLKAQKSNE